MRITSSEAARAIWEELGLPALSAKSPWHGYTLGDWTNTWERYAQRATTGRAIVGVCGAPFKCPPAPSEAALMLHDYLSERGVRDDCKI